jgi:CRISPR/Cas system Type II protein with McrA/HNH and RuvC-like nuclease domain
MTREKEKGNWTATRINMALFDIQMCGFVNYSKNAILSKADYIREAILELMTNNQDFIDSILIQTSNKEVLKKRFKIWIEKLDEIIGDNSYQKRTFPFSVKQELFNRNPFCAISNQRILAIEDAEVDHILPYSKGGKTEIENAQLVLRYFNRAKQNNENYKN